MATKGTKNTKDDGIVHKCTQICTNGGVELNGLEAAARREWMPMGLGRENLVSGGRWFEIVIKRDGRISLEKVEVCEG
ncbi:MAG TPA: hypothetical protein VHQ47_00400 [Phycisphaerae bacterium]|nr:hypothetical protein [Phycisphaerae bacterium]